MFSKKVILVVLGMGLIYGPAHSVEPVDLNNIPPGEGPALPDNLIDQSDIASGELSLHKIRKAGGLVFTTPFNSYDGMGDGPADVYDDSKSFPFRGDRATLQSKNTTMLRINGLDAQTCLECHTTISRAQVPFSMGIGGHGGINNTAMPGTKMLDAAANLGVTDGITETTGRIINPPFMFGAGGIELLAKEMTRDLQAIKAQAEVAASGEAFNLTTKGVHFGTATSNGDGTATVEIDNEHGIDSNLVVRPFGRKGENFSIRDFDRGAMAFHMGIQAVEVVGTDFDGDGDGVENELSIGEMSALSVFLATMPRPRTVHPKGDAVAGQSLFNNIGCTNCHIPELHTESKFLTQSFPDIETDPDANVFMEINLHKGSTKFKKARGGGLTVQLFADLKRHNMGADLAESTGGVLDPFFTTARLWGIADSAPYMHDGRAATLTEAILAHGGEAQGPRDAFNGLAGQQRIELLAFLRSLKLPKQKDVDAIAKLIKSKKGKKRGGWKKGR